MTYPATAARRGCGAVPAARGTVSVRRVHSMVGASARWEGRRRRLGPPWRKIRGASARTTPSGGESMGSARGLSSEAKASSIEGDPDLPIAEVEPAVSAGKVALAGVVGRRERIDEVMLLARSASGVVAVRSFLRLKAPSWHHPASRLPAAWAALHFPQAWPHRRICTEGHGWCRKMPMSVVPPGYSACSQRTCAFVSPCVSPCGCTRSGVRPPNRVDGRSLWTKLWHGRCIVTLTTASGRAGHPRDHRPGLRGHRRTAERGGV
jgi:hypothetical protein